MVTSAPADVELKTRKFTWPSTHKIADIMTRNLPQDDGQRQGTIDAYAQIIDELPREARLALQSAYIFASKAPPEEREELFQEFTFKTLKACNKFCKDKDRNERSLEFFAFTCAKRRWQHWLHDREVHRSIMGGQPIRLNKQLVDQHGDVVELGDLILKENDFADKIIDKLDAEAIFNKLPDKIKPVIQKRLEGKKLTKSEEYRLYEYRRKLGVKLRPPVWGAKGQALAGELKEEAQRLRSQGWRLVEIADKLKMSPAWVIKSCKSIEQVLTCDCGQPFSTTTGLSNHKRTCAKRIQQSAELAKLCYGEGLSLRVSAKRLGIPEATAHTYLKNSNPQSPETFWLDKTPRKGL